MTSTIHIPALRFGQIYRSMDTMTTAGAEVSQVNSGLLRRDLLGVEAAAASLRDIPMVRLFAICAESGRRFLDGDLPVGDLGQTQSAEDYVRQCSASTGLPLALVRNNMGKIAHVLTHMPEILRGLTRGLDPAVIDAGLGEQAGVPVSYFPTTNVLGVVLPSNSPGVNSLWIPALALKIPVVLKPGRDDPWTPWRIIQALTAAGCPRQAFGFYPTGHDGAHALLASCGRSLLFGDAAIAKRYTGDPRVEVHGPGYSKVLIGEDRIDSWREFIPILADSVAANGGRSCVNASCIVVPRYGREIAAALAERLATVVPRNADDPTATLAGFANAAVAESISAAIDAGLAEPGADDCSARIRGTPRLVQHQGRSFLNPTVVRCDSFAHPLSNREFLFPYASVVEVPQRDMLKRIGQSLVVSAITNDPSWKRELLASKLIHRLNLGAMPTCHVQWDQPHEGNLFESLYCRRAVQVVG